MLRIKGCVVLISEQVVFNVAFVVADTFTDALGKLDKQLRWMASGALMDFKANPQNSGFSAHRIESVQDKNFWSARVNDDLRLIYWQNKDLIVMCYVDHHDAAYRWASRRRLGLNGITKAIEFVLTEERVQEIVTTIRRTEETGPPVFELIPESVLRACGVTDEWMGAVKSADHDQFVSQLMNALPDAVSENLYLLATGQTPNYLRERDLDGNLRVLDLPETKRHFWTVQDDSMLERALAAPWEKWAVYLHPSQMEALERQASGPIRISGGPGTGKSVVAVHRVANYLKHESASRVLLTTFSKTLAWKLRESLAYLIGNDDAYWKRVQVTHLHELTSAFLTELTGMKPKLLTEKALIERLKLILDRYEYREFSAEFVAEEWWSVIDSEQIESLEEYQAFRRTGRRTGLQPSQRTRLWRIFADLHSLLDSQTVWSTSRMSRRVVQALSSDSGHTFDHVVVDEVQDLLPWQLRMLKALAGKRESLFMTGDMAQRIYAARTSFLANGIDVRGRSHRLAVNYRTTGDILAFVDHLMPDLIDPDSGVPESRDTVSLLRGEKPEVLSAVDAFDEVRIVSTWLRERVAEGFEPAQLSVFARTRWYLKRVVKAIHEAGLKPVSLEWAGSGSQVESDGVAYGTMHRAKGLEYRAVVLMGCSAAIMPSEKILSTKFDAAAKEDYLEQERNLFYVACSRAREKLLVTGVGELTSLLNPTSAELS